MRERHGVAHDEAWSERRQPLLGMLGLSQVPGGSGCGVGLGISLKLLLNAPMVYLASLIYNIAANRI